MKLSLVFVLGFSLFSCSDLDNDNADFGVEAVNYESGTGDCLELVFPVSFTLPDDSEISAESREDLKVAIAEWKEENPGVRVKPIIVFPVDVVNEEGELSTITTAEELKELKEACRDGKDGLGGKGRKGEKCFQLVFPVSYTLEDGTVISGADKAEIRTALKAYKEENPDVAKPELVFPIQIMNAEGETVAVSTAEELETIKAACKEAGKRTACVEFVYPLSFTMGDGSTITGADKAEIRTAFQAYKEANPDTTVKPVLQFPIEIVTAEGETVSVASQEELAIIKEDCEGGRKGRKGGR